MCTSSVLRTQRHSWTRKPKGSTSSSRFKSRGHFGEHERVEALIQEFIGLFSDHLHGHFNLGVSLTNLEIAFAQVTRKVAASTPSANTLLLHQVSKARGLEPHVRGAAGRGPHRVEARPPRAPTQRQLHARVPPGPLAAWATRNNAVGMEFLEKVQAAVKRWKWEAALTKNRYEGV